MFDEGQGVTSTRVTNDLSFTGITLGPSRGGTADIVIDSEYVGTVEGPAEGLVSFDGFPEFVCKPRGVCFATAVPITLGQPFSFKIDTGMSREFPEFYMGQGE
jgi:hypothetical protein